MILIDTPRQVRFRHFRRTSHMMSDLPVPRDATAELLSFADRIGLKTDWIQSTGTAKEHFDLFDGAIDRAAAAGAVVVSGLDLVERVVRPRRVALAAIAFRERHS